MFWTVTGFAQSSPIEGILDKGDYTLEELLDEDDLIQECKSLNARLIHYLKQPATVEELLRYIVEPPAPESDPGDEDSGDEHEAKRQFKYPYAACEVFCCEVDAIFSTLVEDERLMGQLFSLLDAPRPLNCMLAGYFARVLNSLLLRKTAETMAYLQDRHEELLPKMLAHIDTTSIAEALVRLLGADEQTRVFLHASNLQWLLETPVLQMLLDQLGPGQPPAVQQAAAYVLAAVAETQLSPLAKDLAKPEVMDSLFDRAFAVDGSALVPALNVCIALLEPRSSARESVSPTAAGDFITPQLELKMKTEAVFALAGKVGRLVSFLDQVPTSAGGAAPGPAHDTPFGSLSPPLGSARLKVVELLAALARSGMKPAETALVEGKALQRCMQLFAAYPFNNLLHRHVAGMLATLLEAGSDDTVAALLSGGSVGVPAWLAALPETVVPPGAAAAAAAGEGAAAAGEAAAEGAAAAGEGGSNGSGGGAPATRTTKAWRAGYMGHVTQLGSLLAALAAKRQPVADALAAEPAWAAFVDGYLAPQTARESADAWACGRPNSMDMGGLDSEPDDDDAFGGDLDLEPMPGAGPGVGGPAPGITSGSRRDLCGVPDYRYAGVLSGSGDDGGGLGLGGGLGGDGSPSSSGDEGGGDGGSSSSDEEGGVYGAFARGPPPLDSSDAPGGGAGSDDGGAGDDDDVVLTTEPGSGSNGDGGSTGAAAGGDGKA